MSERDRPPTGADWLGLLRALGGLFLALLGLAGAVAFLGLQFFMAFLLGFAAVVAGLMGRRGR